MISIKHFHCSVAFSMAVVWVRLNRRTARLVFVQESLDNAKVSARQPWYIGRSDAPH